MNPNRVLFQPKGDEGAYYLDTFLDRPIGTRIEGTTYVLEHAKSLRVIAQHKGWLTIDANGVGFTNAIH